VKFRRVSERFEGKEDNEETHWISLELELTILNSLPKHWGIDGEVDSVHPLGNGVSDSSFGLDAIGPAREKEKDENDASKAQSVERRPQRRCHKERESDSHRIKLPPKLLIRLSN